MRKKNRLFITLALVGIGFSVGAAWPPPPLPKANTSEGQWTALPANALLRHSPADMSTLSSQMRWRSDNGVVPGSQESQWRLAGTMKDASPAILIMTQGNEAKTTRVTLGEKLPDGSVLHSVHGDVAETKKDSCITGYQLFHASPVSFSEGCQNAEAPDLGTK